MSAVAAARSALEAAAAASSSGGLSSGAASPLPSPAAAAALHVRWAVIHATSLIGSRFVSEVTSRRSSRSSALQMNFASRQQQTTQHSIVALLSTNSSTLAMEEQLDTTTESPTTYASLSQLLAQASTFDAILVAPGNLETATDRAALASSALRIGKAVLLPRPVELSAAQARALTELARKKSTYLAMPLDAESLLLVADECALGLRNNRSQSSTPSWSATMAVLDVLDDLRRVGEYPSTSAPPSLLLHANNEAAQEVLTDSQDVGGGAQREFPTSSTASNSPSALRTQLYPRPSSRLSQTSETSMTSASVGHGDAQSADRGSLRAQLQELKHVLRQKQAIIVQLEQKAGLAPGSSSSPLITTTNDSNVRSSTVTVTPQTRRRLSSTSGLAEDVRAPSPSGSTSSRRRRRESAGLATPPKGNVALASVREAGAASSSLALGEGFLAPTIASENRRAAVAAATSKESGGGEGGTLSPSGTSGKVIAALTTELEECKAALETTKAALRTAQRQIGTHERQLLEVKAALGRSRAENETNANIVGRKDRQAAEALERARKAEAEAKDLGRASREWGARVRVVEAELGEERRRAGKAEAGYEAISSAWKSTRDRWEAEVKALREQVKSTVEGNAQQARNMVALFQEAKTAWTGRESERESLDNTLERLRIEREKASQLVAKQVSDLVVRLELHEAHIKSQDDTVEECASDVRRIIRLARAADTTTPHA